ncbi:MAG: HAMP domain-containing histidine kinase [Sphingomonadales bacterium]|nr:HAMP domain-containing histidine kinase [Sphingomonadales bacterium]
MTVPIRDGGALVVIAHSEIGAATSQMLLPAVIAAVLAAGLAGLAGSWFFGREIASRIVRIQAGADQIAQGDLSHRLPVDQFDGIFAEQALSLNRMLDRMEDMVRSHRQFASHVAHDLRTPLTRLRALLAECRDASRERLAGSIERADRECGTIISTFDALLRLSEIEAGRHGSGLARLDLRSVVEDVAETMEPVLADAGSTLALGPLAEADVLADNALMQQAFVNLLENVVLHTPPGTRARLSLGRDEARGMALLALEDDGPGIGENDRQRVLDPFVRGQGAVAAQGHGLGLAIVRAIARFHGGSLWLGDAAPGLRVELRLPLAPPA